MRSQARPLPRCFIAAAYFCAISKSRESRCFAVVFVLLVSLKLMKPGTCILNQMAAYKEVLLLCLRVIYYISYFECRNSFSIRNISDILRNFITVVAFSKRQTSAALVYATTTTTTTITTMLVLSNSSTCSARL